MRGKVAKELRRLAAISGMPLKHLKRNWQAAPRNTPRPGRKIYAAVGHKDGKPLFAWVPLRGRRLDDVRAATADVKASLAQSA